MQNSEMKTPAPARGRTRAANGVTTQRQFATIEEVVTNWADNNRRLPGQGLPNMGRVAAHQAALAIGARLMMPSFCEGCVCCIDFADVRLCRLGGGR